MVHQFLLEPHAHRQVPQHSLPPLLEILLKKYFNFVPDLDQYYKYAYGIREFVFLEINKWRKGAVVNEILSLSEAVFFL